MTMDQVWSFPPFRIPSGRTRIVVGGVEGWCCMLGGTVSVDHDVRWYLVNILSGERFKDCETGLKVPRTLLLLVECVDFA